MADLLYWIWLNTVVSPGTETFAHLRAAFSSPEEVFHADEAALRAALPSRYGRAVEALCNHDLRRAHAILDYLVRSDTGVVTYDDRRFPDALRHIKNPPALLYYRGTLPDFDMIFPIAVVGMREESDYATRYTFEISRDLARAGATIVSGLAYGIDAVATAAALSAGGHVIEFIGCGIDRVYPKEHVKLSRLVEANGVIFSEYPPGTPPKGENFPKRNRLISAMSRAVLVTGGKLDSGALITAADAKRQGRDIFALPGSLDDIYAEAPSLLLREGAKAAVCAEDILFTYEKEYPGIINLFKILNEEHVNIRHVLKQAHVAFAKKREKFIYDEKRISSANEFAVEFNDEGRLVTAQSDLKRKPLEELPELAQQIYQQIPLTGACTMDDLVSEEHPIAHVSIAITKLSIAGYVRQGPAGQIERVP